MTKNATQAPDGRWMTRFPPPDGFDGEQWNQYGHDNYVRRLTADEEAASSVGWRSGMKKAAAGATFILPG